MAEFLEEVIVALAAKGKDLPLRDDRTWHTFLYQLSKEKFEPRPAFLDTLGFDWDAPYPRCQGLSEFLQALHWNECVVAANPSFESFGVSPALTELCAKRDKDQALTEFVRRAAQLGAEQLGA